MAPSSTTRGIGAESAALGFVVAAREAVDRCGASSNASQPHSPAAAMANTIRSRPARMLG